MQRGFISHLWGLTENEYWHCDRNAAGTWHSDSSIILDWDFNAEYKLYPDIMQTNFGFIWPWLSCPLTWRTQFVKSQIYALYVWRLHYSSICSGTTQARSRTEHVLNFKHTKSLLGINGILNWCWLFREGYEEQWSNASMRWVAMPPSCLPISASAVYSTEGNSQNSPFWGDFEVVLPIF